MELASEEVKRGGGSKEEHEEGFRGEPALVDEGASDRRLIWLQNCREPGEPRFSNLFLVLFPDSSPFIWIRIFHLLGENDLLPF